LHKDWFQIFLILSSVDLKKLVLHAVFYFTAGGSQDYSAQWAEYYRSVGKIEEAEAIEAQIRAKAVPQPQPAGFPAAPYAAQPGYPAPAGYYPPQQVSSPYLLCSA
jgi:far upstream element-binding protein